MWITCLSLLAVAFILMSIADKAVTFEMIKEYASTLLHYVVRVLRSPFDRPLLWSGVVLAVLVVPVWHQQIRWYSALLMTSVVYAVLRAARKMWDIYGLKIQFRLRDRRVQVAILMTAAVATMFGIAIPWDWVSPFYDPAIRRAESRWQSLDFSRAEMQRSLSDMERQLDSFNAPLADRSYSLPEINRLNAELREMSEKLLDGFQHLLDQHYGYHRLANDAPSVFREAAKALREYGRAEREVHHYPDLADRYEEAAQLWDAHAKYYEHYSYTPLKVNEIQETVRYLHRAHLMFARFHEHEYLEGMAAVEQQRQLEADLRRFVTKFDQLRKSIRGLTRQLNDHGSNLEAPIKPPLARSGAPTVGAHDSTNTVPGPNSAASNFSGRAASKLPVHTVSTARPLLSMNPADSAHDQPSALAATRRPESPQPSSDAARETVDQLKKMPWAAYLATAANRIKDSLRRSRRNVTSDRDPNLPPTATSRRRAATARAAMHQRRWTPAEGDLLYGQSYQVYDGGINPALNNGMHFDLELAVSSVSDDGTAFTGVLTHTTYRKGSRSGYWGAKAHVQGEIDGDRCTLRADRAIYVPQGTLLSRGTLSGAIEHDQLSGTWRSPLGAHGDFEFTLPSAALGAAGSRDPSQADMPR